MRVITHGILLMSPPLVGQAIRELDCKKQQGGGGTPQPIEVQKREGKLTPWSAAGYLNCGYPTIHKSLGSPWNGSTYKNESPAPYDQSNQLLVE